MFRDENINAENFRQKLRELKKKLDERVEIRLDAEYHHQLKAYILRIYQLSCIDEDFDDKKLEDIREPEMSQLNRLQKLKNGTSYRKDKHKRKCQNEDWG